MYDFLPTQPQPFNYMDSLKQLSLPGQMEVPYSPATANGTPPVNGPAGAFQYRNPYDYTSWGQAGGIGKYIGANAPLFGAGMDFLSKGFGVYAGLQSLGMAKDALAFEKKSFNKNFAAQTSSYNTQMRDRIAGRSYATEAERQAALDSALLPEEEKKKNGG